jgi:hypothetical protein
MFAAEIRKRRIEGMSSSSWRWHLDEVFVKVNGERHYLRRAVDHEDEGLESYVTKTRDKKAALKFLEESDAQARSPGGHRDRQVALLRRRAEGDRCICSAENRPVGQQPSGELTSAVPTTRAGDAPVPPYAKFAEVRHRPRLGLQPFQHRPKPL